MSGMFGAYFAQALGKGLLDHSAALGKAEAESKQSAQDFQRELVMEQYKASLEDARDANKANRERSDKDRDVLRENNLFKAAQMFDEIQKNPTMSRLMLSEAVRNDVDPSALSFVLGLPSKVLGGEPLPENPPPEVQAQVRTAMEFVRQFADRNVFGDKLKAAQQGEQAQMETGLLSAYMQANTPQQRANTSAAVSNFGAARSAMNPPQPMSPYEQARLAQGAGTQAEQTRQWQVQQQVAAIDKQIAQASKALESAVVKYDTEARARVTQQIESLNAQKAQLLGMGRAPSPAPAPTGGFSFSEAIKRMP